MLAKETFSMKLKTNRLVNNNHCSTKFIQRPNYQNQIKLPVGG